MGVAGMELQELELEVSNRHLTRPLCRCQATQCTLLLHHLPPSSSSSFSCNLGPATKIRVECNPGPKVWFQSGQCSS